ncbi:Piezo-type mechanosensitive ion channel component 2 [Acipenser ruthenus]|uniref:Piezo-type mechanosensitive ion channel component 2 n=1 Tax=Acipenser ruthenus TaxID=7906 RepID=A0A444UXD5_ACIRT|nr:Piezo-type mechanosensitive ion channel component 2 [Acipenser ruthenus]
MREIVHLQIGQCGNQIGSKSTYKYFINYFFYKFGLEVCSVVAVNVIGQRMDFYAMLHSFALIAVLSRRRRKSIAEIWPKYCCFTASLMTFQYLLCVGIPPALCTDYPWRTGSTPLNSNLIKWLYLPDFARRPNPIFLIYDHMLLLCASLQWQVFEDENTTAVRLLAGDNVEISRSLDPRTLSQYIPVPDFIHCRSYLDIVKMFVFSYFFWFVLSLIFITGTTRINIFCMGYLISCFYFMLFGGSLLLKPVRHILKLWDLLIGYTVLVIAMKNILSLGACAYLHILLKNSCWFIQTFTSPDDECELPEGEAGIVWDAICFTFLLAQRRVFVSYYFLYIVADLKTSKILASRGAELFEAKVKKGIAARLELEKKSMELLKKHWLTLVLLIWSCVIWMLRDRRRYALLSSPFLVLYGNVLVVCNFFTGLTLRQDELFPGIPDPVLQDLDLKRYPTPCVHLVAKVTYTFTFCLLLRQHLTEKKELETLREEPLAEVKVSEAGQDESRAAVMEVLGSLIKGTLVKYWIYFCCSMFFVVSFSGKVVVYKILYIMLFLFCIALYQVRYDLWRRVLKYFWIVVVAYSTAVLIIIYIYQFKTVSGLFRQTLGMSEEGLRDLGLEQYDTVELFARILLPSSFLLACILQLHYFNSDFLTLTDLSSIPVREGPCRLSEVSGWNTVRLLAPDLGMFLAGVVIYRLCKKLVRPRQPLTAHDNDNMQPDNEEMGQMDTEESAEETEESTYSTTEETKEPENRRPKFILKIITFIGGLQLLLGEILNTAGKVVVTILLGLAGITVPSLTTISLVLFSSLCVMMAIFSMGHLVGLYLYQLQFFQDLVPPHDIYARLFGMTAFIQTNASEPSRLQLHAGVTWPVFLNPLVLLVLYFTLVALLQKWVYITEEVTLPKCDSKLTNGAHNLGRMMWTSGNDMKKVTNVKKYFACGEDRVGVNMYSTFNRIADHEATDQ